MRPRLAAFLVAPLMWLAVPATPAHAQMLYPRPYGYPYVYPYRGVGAEADVRVDVKPKQAMVYVDGYYAGQVDDFDGIFQRLHVAPGDHEIVVYMQGFHSLRQKLYLGPYTTRKITARLEPLRAGEANDPVPVPANPPEAAAPQPPMPPMPPMPRRGPGRYPPPPPPPDNGPDGGASGGASTAAPSPTSGGTAVIQVQPGGSDIAIDGQHWMGPARPDERLIVQLAQGHHVIEIHKSGYRDMRTEIDVQPGATIPINASLTPDR